MSGSVTPLGKIVYVCDDVLQDPVVGKFHILGAFNFVRIPPDGSFPYRLDRLCVFAQLAGGLGTSLVEVKVIEAAAGSELFGSPAYRVTFRGGNSVTSVLIRMLNCPFPGPGTYLVQLYCQGEFLDDRRLTVS
ncbi:MAG: DUF6941 family protein [Gemmataceae bacterium]